MSWLTDPTPPPDVKQEFPKVTRVVVIDGTGIIISRYRQNDVRLEVQDGGRTLKLWLRDGLDFSDGTL